MSYVLCPMSCINTLLLLFPSTIISQLNSRPLPSILLSQASSSLPSTMQFFKKSNKNKTASASATPAQTPRVSMEGSRPVLTAEQQKQAKDAEILYNMIAKAVSGGQNVACVEGFIDMIRRVKVGIHISKYFVVTRATAILVPPQAERDNLRRGARTLPSRSAVGEYIEEDRRIRQ
ncbi:hypothetical protein B0O80DRAFT_527665 [Mortierella sp. GBAus27b]|nr:hypothetical protein B0O80DRAFT_527665 [Mortierella sp. GBAus27b]